MAERGRFSSGEIERGTKLLAVLFSASYSFCANNLVTENTHPITLGMSGFSAEQIILKEYHDTYESTKS
jgi:hypothetical protein